MEKALKSIIIFLMSFMALFVGFSIWKVLMDGMILFTMADLVNTFLWSIMFSFLIMILMFFIDAMDSDDWQMFIALPLIGMLPAVIYYLTALLITYIKTGHLGVPFPWGMAIVGFIIGLVLAVFRVIITVSKGEE